MQTPKKKLNKKIYLELSNEIQVFLKSNLTRSLSTFAELKIFTSAYMHIMNSFAVYIRPDSLLDTEPEEILDLWGLAFCKISHFNELFRQDINVLEGMSEKQKQEIKNQLNEKKNIIDISAFILLDKSDQKTITFEIESDLTQKLAKTHHRLSSEKFTLWWNLDATEKPTKLPKNFSNTPFYDPFIVNFGERNILSNIDEKQFTYNRGLIPIPTKYFKKLEQPKKGKMLVVHVDEIDKFQKRKLVELTNKVLFCGFTGIPVLESKDNSQILCNPNDHTYQYVLAKKFCSKVEEFPTRQIIPLKGTWMAVHLENNAVSHFLFEVLKKVLYAARVVKFGLLITGVKPAPHILEFFTVDSELKDKITDIKICNPDVFYKPQKSILAFEYHREFRPEDLLNFQWFGESVISRSNDQENFGEKIYISRRDSPGSRIIINENYLTSNLKRNGFKILRFDQLSLIQKLVAIKNAKEIITGAGSGYLFRYLISTNNLVKIITSDSYVWNDFSICATGIGVRNETFIIFEKEMSLASNYYASCRNHASIKITQDFFKKHEDIKWGEKNVLWAFDSISSSMTSASN